VIDLFTDFANFAAPFRQHFRMKSPRLILAASLLIISSLASEAAIHFWNGSTFSDVSATFERVQADYGNPVGTYLPLGNNGILNLGGGSTVDTNSLSGAVTYWAFASNTNGYIETTDSIYFWNGSTLSDVSATFQRVQVDYGGPGSYYSWLTTSDILNVYGAMIDTSSLSGTITNWAFVSASNGYIETSPVPEASSVLLICMSATTLLCRRQRPQAA